MSRVFNNSTSNFLRAASNAAYSLSAFGTGSVAAWVKRASIGAQAYIINQPTGTYGAYLFSDNKLYAATGGSNSTTTVADTTTWHHIAITWNSTTIKVYIDGTDVTSASSGHILSGQDTIDIGLGNSGAIAFDGKIAYVAVWNTELTAGNITTLQTSATPESVGSGCIGSWHLDTSSLADSSATNNIMVVNGTVTFDTDNPTLSGGGGATVIGLYGSHVGLGAGSIF